MNKINNQIINIKLIPPEIDVIFHAILNNYLRLESILETGAIQDISKNEEEKKLHISHAKHEMETILILWKKIQITIGDVNGNRDFHAMRKTVEGHIADIEKQKNN